MYTLEANQVTNQTHQELLPISSANIAPKPKDLTEKIIAETERLDQQGTYDKLNNYFTEQDLEQKKILEGRSLLGDKNENVTDEQVLTLIGSVQFLVDMWLEEYERLIFDGKTLQEVFDLGKL